MNNVAKIPADRNFIVFVTGADVAIVGVERDRLRA